MKKYLILFVFILSSHVFSFEERKKWTTVEFAESLLEMVNQCKRGVGEKRITSKMFRGKKEGHHISDIIKFYKVFKLDLTNPKFTLWGTSAQTNCNGYITSLVSVGLLEKVHEKENYIHVCANFNSLRKCLRYSEEDRVLDEKRGSIKPLNIGHDTSLQFPKSSGK